MITFLNPIILIGFAAAAIPVLLHLLNLRKLQTVEFSTLTFLKELQQSKIRRLKLRQLLLLFVRTLLIIFLVLAFARPALRGSLFGTIDTNARTTYVIIIDDSFSMMASDENGVRFKQAQEICNGLIDMLNEGDEVFLVKLSDVPNATIDPATHDASALRTLLRETKVSAIHRSLEDALRLTSKLLTQSKNANREVYIISDFQKTLIDWKYPQNTQKVSSFFDEHVRFFVINVGGNKVINNVAIDSVEVTTTIIEQGKPITLRVHVNNFSEMSLKNYVVSVFLDAIRVAQQSIDIEPWGSAKVEFVVTPKRTGLIKGYAELEHDAIELDNKRYFTLTVPEQIKTIIITENQSDSYYALLALQSGSQQQEKPLVNSELSTFNQLSTIDLNRVDVLILIGAKITSLGLMERIKNFVESGGGLILFPSSDFQLKDFNQNFLQLFSIPQVDGLFSTSGVLTFSTVDYDHPIFMTVFETPKSNIQRKPSIESPTMSKVIQRSVGKQSHVVINLSNGQPFLSEHQLGDGKILFYSVAPVLSWSNFPLTGIFAPLMYRSVMYVSSKGKSIPSYIAGDNAVLTFPYTKRLPQSGQYSIISPDGIEEFLQPKSLTAEYRFQNTIVLQPKLFATTGIYDVKAGSTVLTSFAVNIDGRESDARKMSDKDFERLWEKLGITPGTVHFVNNKERLQAAVLELRFGVEFWKYCVVIALIFALLEMIIARDNKKEVEALTAPAVR